MEYAKNKKLNKRLNPTNWKELDNHFNAEKNREVFGSDKNIREAVRNLFKTPIDKHLEQKEPQMRTFDVSMKKAKGKNNLLKKLKNSLKKLQALLSDSSDKLQKSPIADDKQKDYYADKDNEQQPQETKDKDKNKTQEEPQLLYETKVDAQIYSPNNNEYEEYDDSEQEPQINPEWLKPLEVNKESQDSETGSTTGGAAGISENSEVSSKNNQNTGKLLGNLSGKTVTQPLLSNGFVSHEFDFFKESVKDKMSYLRSFIYDMNAGKEEDISSLSRKIDNLNKTLEKMQAQLDYHERVVNIYNCPDLAEFYLYDVVDSILADLLDDYILMMGFDPNL